MDWCDRCLGRRLMGAQGPDPQRAAAAAYRTEHDLDEVAEEDCLVCEGRFADEAAWLRTLLEALGPYSFSTFQLGTIFPAPCEAMEKEHDLNPEIGDTIRTEANRLLAPQVAAATGAAWVPEGRPEVAVTLDTRFWTAEVNSHAVFLLGKYTKHRRDVPQTHWPCKTCQGSGCHQCEDRGWMYESSVEQAIGDIVAPAFGSTAYSFHGAGREDIDALMLGTGRPFVLELTQPLQREAPMDILVQAIQEAKPESGVGVLELAPTARETVAEIKAAAYDKEYLAHCVTEAEMSRSQVEKAVQQMTGAVLEQRTPQRVSHRRADLVRQRRVHYMVLEDMPDGHHFSVRVRADSGAYIKEMVSGDERRTSPNLAEVLGVPCRVEFLDVMAILEETPAS